MMLSLAISILAFVLSVVGLVISTRQLREARRANILPAAIDLFREYRSPEMMMARALVFKALKPSQGERPNPTLGLQDLPADVGASAIRVSHFLDHLGVLVANDLMSPEMAASFLGDSAQNLWSTLGDYIEEERKLRRSPEFQKNFQKLVEALAAVYAR
jgi:hypothetical protein